MQSTRRLMATRISLVLFILLLACCAQIVAPTGGAQDTIPPKVEKEYPSNKKTSFTGNKITIKFDEYIQLKDAEEQIVISPPLAEKPLFTVLGKSLNIQLMGVLSPGITYTINFGNSITDNHEGNILSNYSYIFSTGSFIDTLSISGSLKQAFNLKTEKGLSVCLYPIDSFIDSTIYKQKPYYFTKTNESGFYTLPNLPNQTYKLVAFKDENKNLKYDKGEWIGFKEEPINTSDSNTVKTLYFFNPNLYGINKLVDTFSREQGRFTFVVFKPTGVTVKPIIPVNYHTWYKKGKDNIDTLTLFSSAWKTDSVLFSYHTPILDSVIVVKPRKSSKAGKFEITLNKDIELNDSFIINLNHPLEQFFTDTAKLKVKEDSILINPTIILAPNKESIKLFYPLKEKQKYSLILADSAIKDIYGNYSKSEKYSFGTKTIKDYSSLVLSVIHPNDSNQYILQLIDENETKVIKEFIITKTTDINLEYVLPAKYRVKFIQDTNTNGIWDNGDYMAHKQPEKVFYYPDVLTLRAYWDLEQTIDMGKIVD